MRETPKLEHLRGLFPFRRTVDGTKNGARLRSKASCSLHQRLWSQI